MDGSWLRGAPTDSYNTATTLPTISVYALYPRTGTIWTLVDGGEVMMPFKEQRIPALMVVTCFFFLVSCVAHHADDRYGKKQEAKKHRSASQTLEMKKTIPIDEQPVQPEEVSPGEDAYQQTIRRGKALFNGKAVCFRCHGQNGNIRTVSNVEISRLNPKPTDLRNPTDKSVRQLYLIIKYGIPATAMVPIQESARLSDDEVLNLISYILNLQGTRLSLDSISIQRFRRHTATDVSIKRMCDEEVTGDSGLKDDCEARYAKRYLDLIIGRPPDIPANRHIKIEARCKLQANKDLDKLVLCYRDQYSSLRKTSR
ncbi:MAG: cytochrome c [Nitrospira sp.]|nr:cytochrome c [Nitrospira sp.]